VAEIIGTCYCSLSTVITSLIRDLARESAKISSSKGIRDEAQAFVDPLE